MATIFTILLMSIYDVSYILHSIENSKYDDNDKRIQRHQEPISLLPREAVLRVWHRLKPNDNNEQSELLNKVIK